MLEENCVFYIIDYDIDHDNELRCNWCKLFLIQFCGFSLQWKWTNIFIEIRSVSSICIPSFLVTHSIHLFLPATGWEMERGRGKKWKMSIKWDRITTRGLFRHTFYDKGANGRKKTLLEYEMS